MVTYISALWLISCNVQTILDGRQNGLRFGDFGDVDGMVKAMAIRECFLLPANIRLVYRLGSEDICVENKTDRPAYVSLLRNPNWVEMGPGVEACVVPVA